MSQEADAAPAGTNSIQRYRVAAGTEANGIEMGAAVIDINVVITVACGKRVSSASENNSGLSFFQR